MMAALQEETESRDKSFSFQAIEGALFFSRILRIDRLDVGPYFEYTSSISFAQKK